jgi:large subunit ribosomal protein L4
MKVSIKKLDGTKAADISVEKQVFGIIPNDAVVRQAILAEMTNMRQGTHSSKNRSKVRGGGKKPWKQKGRGVARAGTIRSPLWKGGGTIFGPEPHDYKHKLPKKISQLARKSVLSNKLSESELIVIDEITLDSNKTKDFVTILKKLELYGKKITLLVCGLEENLDLASRNLKDVYIVDAAKASTYDIIDCDILVMDKASLAIITKILKN